MKYLIIITESITFILDLWNYYKEHQNQPINMSKKEILLIFAALGFFIIWILDLRAGLPAGFEPTFWNKIFYHYSWLMFAAGCLFYFQYSKQNRLKKEEELERNKPVEKIKDDKKAQRTALIKGKK